MHEVCALLQVCQLANYLKSVGVKRGSDVTIYMPMIPELPAAMVCRSCCSPLPISRPARWRYAADVLCGGSHAQSAFKITQHVVYTVTG